MKTILSNDNPHKCNRYGFAWQNIPFGTKTHLDFGCNDGTFPATLSSKKIENLRSVDVSQEAVSKAQRLFPDLDIMHISKTFPLSYEEKTFTSITVLDVLEHVYEQRKLLDELYRILKDDGILIITVPRQHLFSFLDLGNFKFFFPRLHRFYYCMGHSKEDYEYRYVSNPDGLVGDISTPKQRHEHFTRSKLKNLLDNSGFDAYDFDGTGFFRRLINCVFILPKKIKPLYRLFVKLNYLDSKLFESANLFCLARKRCGNKIIDNKMSQ